MSRLDLSLLPIPDAVNRLQVWLEPQLPKKLIHQNEKISDAELVAVTM